MSHLNWQRRSSSLQRPSHDPSRPGRFVDRGSRIPLPRSSSAQPHGQASSKDAPCFKRSKSTLGPQYTPQEKLMSASKITPLNQIIVPKFTGYSSQKSGFQKEQRNLHDREFQKEAAHTEGSMKMGNDKNGIFGRNISEESANFKHVKSEICLYCKVLYYFQNNHPSALLKTGEIRPMTIKMFIEMVNHLFAHLGIYNTDEPVQFTTSNYEKELPQWMRLLDYPGFNSSKGWLQTVNVPQCWPQVLGFLYWLVCMMEGRNQFNLEKQLMEGIRDEKDQQFTVMYLRGCFQGYVRRMAGDDSPYDDICKEVVSFAEHINGVTEDVIVKLQEDNEKLAQKLDDPELKVEKDCLDELEQRQCVAQGLVAKALEEMELKLESIASSTAAAIKKEKNIASIKIETERIRSEVEELSKIVQSQSMSVTEFTELKKKCDYLLKEISYTEKECDDIEKLFSRCELDIAAKRDKILQNASTFNRHVIQLEQQVPELQGLRVRMNPESVEVIEEIERLVQVLRDLRSRLTAELEELQELGKEMQLRIERTKQRLAETSAQEVTSREKVIAQKGKIVRMKENIAKEEIDLKNEVEELEKRQIVCQQKQKDINELKDKQATLEKRYEVMKKAEAKMIELVAKKEKQLEEKVKYYKCEIAKLRKKVADSEENIKTQVGEMISQFELLADK